MGSLILSTTIRLILPLLLLFSVYLLLRGHNAPGGGFVGGLVASISFVLYFFATNVTKARQALRIDPRMLIGIGLLIAVSSATLSLFMDKPFMTGLWGKTILPVVGKLGTPVFFDVGVDMVVLGVMLTIVFTLAERE